MHRPVARPLHSTPLFGIDLRREPVGDLPRQMADRLGLGIGVERLCMAASGVKDISRFQQSPMY